MANSVKIGGILVFFQSYDYLVKCKNVWLENDIIEAFTKECGTDYSLKLNNIINDYNLNENELAKKFFIFINEEKDFWDLKSKEDLLT